MDTGWKRWRWKPETEIEEAYVHNVVSSIIPDRHRHKDIGTRKETYTDTKQYLGQYPNHARK